MRSRILLACAEGHTNAAVADRLGLSPATVGKWRRRFQLLGLAGLDDRVRSGRPRSGDAARISELIGGPTTSDTDGASTLSTRELAAAMGVSQSTAARRRREELGHPRSRPATATSAPVSDQLTSRPELWSDRVYETIRGWILSGELSPGTRVVESEVARLLGTSQAPAREAVRRLAHEGLVTHRPRQGNFVTVISPIEAREAREIRAVLETAAARRAAGHLSAADLDALRAEVRRMCAAADVKDIGAFREADMRFHRRACGYSGNSMLLRIWRMLEATLWNLQVVSSAMYSGDWRAMALRHEDLINALADGDPAEAARLFSAHARGESSITKPARARQHG